MKLIDKKDLMFMDGMLVAPDNEVIPMDTLAEEVNEIVEMNEFVKFVLDNRTRIESGLEGKLTFSPAHTTKPVISTSRTVATPLNDAFEADAQARAQEWLDKQAVEDIDLHLRRYVAIAAWLSVDYIKVYADIYNESTLFKSNPLEITESMVIETFDAFNDPDIKKLMKGVVVGR